MKNHIYTFKVSADRKTFRIIEIKGENTLDELANIIVESFDFDMDHAFGFYNNIDDLYSSDEVYELFADIDGCDPTVDNAQGVKKTKIYSVFEPEKKMLFLFDYGDDWIFLIECQSMTEPLEKTRYPRITKKVGKSPEQYPDYD